MKQVLKFAVLALASLLAASPAPAVATCFESNSGHCATICCVEMGNTPSRQMSVGCGVLKTAALAEVPCSRGGCSVTSSEPSQVSAQTGLYGGHETQPVEWSASSEPSLRDTAEAGPIRDLGSQPARHLLLQVFRI